MDSKWFIGTEDKDKRKKELLSYRNAFEDLTDILVQLIEKEAVRDYGPGWDHKQIARNEYNQAIKDVLHLINIKDK